MLGCVDESDFIIDVKTEQLLVAQGCRRIPVHRRPRGDQAIRERATEHEQACTAGTNGIGRPDSE